MKNVKFRGKKKNSAVNSAAQIPQQKPKFRGSARNSAARGKLWALLITQPYVKPGAACLIQVYSSFFYHYYHHHHHRHHHHHHHHQCCAPLKYCHFHVSF